MEKPAIIKPGAIIMGKVCLVCNDGNGLLDIDDYPVLVPNVVEGEQVVVKIVEVLPLFAEAEKIVPPDITKIGSLTIYSPKELQTMSVKERLDYFAHLSIKVEKINSPPKALLVYLGRLDEITDELN